MEIGPEALLDFEPKQDEEGTSETASGDQLISNDLSEEGSEKE